MGSKKELVLKALHNEIPERIPTGFWFHFLKDPSKFNAGLDDPAVLEENLAGARRFKDEFDPDFVKIMTDGYFFVPVTGSTLETVRPDPERLDAYITHLVRLVSGVREIYGEDILLFLNLFAPLAVVQRAVTPAVTPGKPERIILKSLEEKPGAAAEAFDRVADGISAVIRELVKPGLADGIYLSVNTLGNTIPEDLYRSFVAPSEKKVLQAAKEASPDNILHICGYLGSRNNLAVYRDYDVEAVNWAVHAEGVGLKEGKAFFGGKPVIGGFGNAKADVLYAGTKAEVEAETARILSDAGKAGVIIGADCTVPSDIDLQRLEWVRRKAAEISAE